MTVADLLTFDGITQPVSEWALDYGIPAELIIERLQQGQSVEAAITTMMPFATPQRDGRAHSYTHDGVALTIREWAARSGVPRATLTQRLRRGMSIGEAINPDLNRKNVTHTHNGETRTVREWADHTGINYETLHYRLRKLGMSIGDAIAMQKHAKPSSCKHRLSTLKGELAPVVITLAGYRIEIATNGRGVVVNFEPSIGTGGGSTAQESAQIDFPQDAP